MGYLTTITFSNDAADIFEKCPEQTIQMIHDAQSGALTRNGNRSVPIGYHCNPVIIQRPRHADDSTLYFHSDNTVTEISEIDGSNERVLEAAIQQLAWRLKVLRQIKKDKSTSAK